MKVDDGFYYVRVRGMWRLKLALWLIRWAVRLRLLSVDAATIECNARIARRRVELRVGHSGEWRDIGTLSLRVALP